MGMSHVPSLAFVSFSNAHGSSLDGVLHTKCAAGPVKPLPDRVVTCEDGEDCVFEVEGENLNFLTNKSGRLALLESCGVR